LSANGTNTTGGDIPDVNSLIFIEGNGLTAVEHLQLDGRAVFTGSEDHPAVTRLALDLLAIRASIFVFLNGAEDQTFLFSQDEDVLDARFKGFTGEEEEGALSLHQLSLSELGLAILTDRVGNDAILPVGQGDDVHLIDNLLVNSGDVRFSFLGGDQPFLSVLADVVVSISEGAKGAEVKSDLVGQDDSMNKVNNFLINSGEVSSSLGDNPFLSCNMFNSIATLAVQTSSKAKSLIGANDSGSNNLNNFHRDMGKVGSGTFKEPFISSTTFNSIKLHITNGANAKSTVGLDDGQRSDRSNQNFSRVEREGILGQTDLTISMTKLDLSSFINDCLVVVIKISGIFNDAVLTRGDDDHLGGTHKDLLMILANEGLGTNLKTGHVGVLIQDMEVVVRGDSNQAGGLGRHLD